MRTRRVTVEDLDELHADTRRCAERAGLVYVDGAPAGITRRRRGQGFSYLAESGPVDAITRARIAELAIPPAWRQVWICPDPDAHLLATGVDDKGRKQYLYHPQWREHRDLINFYRLIVVARALPPLRRFVDAQLRRRSIDRDRVIATMLALLDTSLIRIGNEVYAEENDSIGLCTLSRHHVEFGSRHARLTFPAKSGMQAELTVRQPGVLRVLRELAKQPGERLFAVDERPIDADELNSAIATITTQRVTAKDFRTWGGTRTAFSVLRPHAGDEPVPDHLVLAAVDAASAALGNTRAVARAHYVHPHVVEAFATGASGDLLRRTRRRRDPLLSDDERALAALLDVLFVDKFSASPSGAVQR